MSYGIATLTKKLTYLERFVAKGAYRDNWNLVDDPLKQK